jgi:hypothetical protein
MLDLRREVRTPINLRGLIKYGAAGLTLPCTVRDLTRSGAGLTLSTTFGVPQVFRLAVDGESTDRYCRVMWTEGKKLGVAFQ